MIVILLNVKNNKDTVSHTGTLYLSTIPEGATVAINSKEEQKVTPVELEIPRNKTIHLSLTKEGYFPKNLKFKLLSSSTKREYTLISNQDTPLVKTQIKPSATQSTGTTEAINIHSKLPALININSKPKGASVFIESDFVCKTPCTYTKGLTNTILNIDIKEKGYESYFAAYTIKNTSNTLNVVLDKDQSQYGLLSISSSIPNANISINGKLITNQTPLARYKIKPGKHTVTITKRVGATMKTATEVIQIPARRHIIKNFVLK